LYEELVIQKRIKLTFNAANSHLFTLNYITRVKKANIRIP